MFGSTNNTGFGGFGQQQQQNNAQPGGQQTGGLFGQQNQQPANPAGGFGGFGAQQQPQQPAFGAGTSAGGGLFGAAQQPAQQQGAGGFQFGQTNNASAPAFGQPQNKPAGFGGFGSSTTTANTGGGFGGFGASTNTQQNAFGAANTGANAFGGAKPAGSLFGQAQPQQQAQQGGLFGQPAATGSMFGGGAAGLSAQQTGGMPTQGTSNPPYQPFVNTEKDATGSGSTNYQYNTITCLPAYRAASIEELRVQDYQQGRKSGNAGPGSTLGGTFGQPAATTGFGQPAPTGGLFGQTQQTGGGFGSGGGLFGQQQNNQQQNTGGGLFGQSNTNTGGGLFGQQQNTQPGQTGGLFGQNNQQASATGFGFGGQQQPQQQQPQQAGSGFTFGQNNQQNKPGGLFGGSTGGFGSTAAAPASNTGGFTFGGSSQPSQTNTGGGFGASSNTGGFGFGAANNQPKPGGLFGQPAASTGTGFGGFGASAPAADANKPAFSFGGTGFGASAAPGQQTTAAPTGGLFGSSQPAGTAPASSGFTFGASSNTQQQQGSGLFGGAQQTTQPSTTFGGGLFGQNKPATGGGLFGSTQQNAGQQQGASGFSFGAASAAPSSSGLAAGGGLFGGGSANKPGGLFGSGGFGGSSQPGQTGGLFGSSTTASQQPGGGLFGAQNNAGTAGTGGGGLFGGSTAPGSSSNTAGGGLFGGGGSSFGASGFGGQQSSSLFGSQAQSQARPNLQASLNVNPYGTDALFGGSASVQGGGVNSLGGLGSVGLAGGSQTLLPFNVARPAAKKQPPLVPPFRPSPRNTARVAKLRGSTPGIAYGSSPTPGRESTPSLFTSSTAGTRLSSPSVASNSSLFRGLSDDLPRSQREGSLPAQAFVSRPSVKRLVLDDQTNKSLASTHGRSQSLFASTRDSASATPGPQNRPVGSLFDRSTPVVNAQRVNFSPALETAASSRTPNGRISAPDDSTFSVRDASVFGGEPSPSKGAMEFVGRDHSLPSFQPLKGAKSTAVNANEDALLPLDYYTKPPLSELREWSYAELSAVEGFIVGRKGYGKVEFVEPVDLNTVGELGNVPGGIVQLRKKECYVYPDEEDCFDPDTGHERDGVQPGFDPKRIPGGKAKMGTGLNVPAVVHLEGCWPIDRSTRQPIKEADHVRVKQLISKLKRRQDMSFRSYEAVTGTWTFRVEHFSRYGLDSDEDEDEEVMDGVTKDERQQEKEKTNREITPRQPSKDAHMTSRSRSQTPSAVPTPSEATASQPWAATLGLEARRLQVMQASFFGGDARTQVYEGTAATSRKKGRETDAKVQTSKDVGARAHFGAPMKKTSVVSSKAVSSGNVLAEKDEIMDELTSSAKVSIRPHKVSKLIPETSIVDGAHDLILDAGLALGRSFHAGWGQEGTLVHRSPLRVSSQEDRSEEQTAMGQIGLVRQSRLDIFQGDNAKRQEDLCLTLLETQLENAIVEVDEVDEDGDTCPVAYPDPQLRFKHFAGALDDSLDDSRGSNTRRYELAVFRLASALFDEIDLQLDPTSVSPAVRANAMRLRRKNAVSDWLRWYVDEGLRSEIRGHHASTLPSSTSGERIIFSLLSAGQFEEACRQALDIGDVRLATLLAQIDGGGSDEEFRLDLLDQLSVWRAGGVDVFVSQEYRRIFELLSGNVHISKGNGKRDEAERVGDLAVCHGLDWKRTFSCFLHFNLSFEAGLEEVVTAFERSVGRGEGDQVIVPPLPPYLERDVRPGSKRFRDVIKSKAYPVDVLFSLLKLFSHGDYALESVLDAKQYCPSPLNVSLAFHLGQLLSRVLGVRDFSDRVDLGIEGETIARLTNQRGNSATHDNLCVHYALQLETIGQWTWAAFVLLHLEMRESRRENIRALLARNVGRLIDGDDQAIRAEGFLVQTLKIPARWIDEARADHAGYTNDRYGEYRHLLRARLYGRAHDVAICFLAPEAIVRHDFALILDLFAPFRKRDIRAALQQSVATDPPAGNLSTSSTDIADGNVDGAENMEQADDGSGDEIDVPGWQRGGQVYVDYIATCRSLPWLVANHAEGVLSALEREPFQDGSAAHIDALCTHLASIAGQTTADAVRRIDSMARKLPDLMKRIDELFDAFANTRGHRTTLIVARSQMVTSLDNCVRSLRSSRTLARLVAVLPSLDVDTYADSARNNDSDRAPIEVESIQFMANAYCSNLIEGSA